MLTAISATSTTRRTGRASLGAGGYSLLELMAVVVILMILMAIATPNFIKIYHDLRLKSACDDISGFMQRARLQAAKQNATYTIGYRSSGSVEQVYLDLNLNGQWDAGEPLLAFYSTLIPASTPPTGTGGTPTPYVLVGDTSGVVYNNSTTLGYSPRALPCAYTAGVCATPAGGYFVYYFEDQLGPLWGAVIVTRTGRTKTAVWNGTAWN